MMNLTFLFIVVAFGTAAKPSLREIASAKEWTMVNKEVILTAGGQIITVRANVTQVLKSLEVNPTQSSRDAYDCFVWGYRKRAQKYTALISAYAYEIILCKNQGNEEEEVLDVVQDSLVKFDTRLRMLSDHDDVNEFQLSWTELQRVRTDHVACHESVLEFLSKTKDGFHQIVADQCVPEGGGRDILSPKTPVKPIQEPRIKKAGNLTIIGSTRKPRESYYPSRLSKLFHGNIFHRLRHRKSNRTSANSQLDSNEGQTVTHDEKISKPDSCRGEVTKVSSGTSEEVSAAGTDKTIGNRCDLSDMYGLVADSNVWDVFLENNKKPSIDLKRILDELKQAYSIEENNYSVA